MDINELFDYILSKGCGTDLDAYKDSSEYKRLTEKQNTLFERYTESTDEGTMLRAGQFASSLLLNCYSEPEALLRSKTEKSSFGHKTECRPMLNFIGNEIIRAAKDQLPPEAFYLASMWKNANADEQVSITCELYRLLTNDSQRDSKEMSMDNLLSIIQEEQTKNSEFRGEDSCLPLIYGKWNNEHHLANCQGKSQMIIAFANMVGANVILMNPNTTAREVVEEQRKIGLEKVYNDIIERKIAFPDPSFMDSLSASRLKSEMKLKSNAFHLCPVIQIKDGRWIVIDSNNLNWGILGDEWGMDKIYPKLEKYSEVLPGVALYASDYKQRDRAIKAMWKEFDEILNHSKKVEELLAPTGELNEMIDALARSSELDFLLSKTLDMANVNEMDSGSRKFFATRILIGDPENLFSDFLEDTQNFNQKKKDSLYTFYHCLAVDLIDDRWNEDGHIVHSEASFVYDTTYHIAISAINSVGIDNDVYGTSSLLVEYSCCQTTMHNAILSPCTTFELSKAAATNLSLMPFMHNLTKQSLTIKKYLDEQKEFMLRRGL